LLTLNFAYRVLYGFYFIIVVNGHQFPKHHEWLLIIMETQGVFFAVGTNSFYLTGVLLGVFAKFKKWQLNSHVYLSTWNNSAPTGRNLMKFGWVFFENLSIKFKLHYIWTRVMGTLHDKQCTFSIMSLSALLIMRNLSDMSCIKNQNTLFIFDNFLFFCLDVTSL
jgi:hypothetical protein